MRRPIELNKPFCRASMQSDCLELMIYGDVGEDQWTGEGITAKSVKQQLDTAGEHSRISLRINSPGGNAFEGVAIGNVLKSAGKPINVYVDGIAASAASIIAMCGDTITMAPNAMMIHRAWTIGMGNTNDFTKLADTLAKVDEAIARTYVDRTGKPLSEVEKLMTDETWMSAQDCLDGGFATAIADGDDASAMAMARQFKSMARYKKLPAALKADAECKCDCAACLDGRCDDCNNSSCDDQDCEDCPMQLSASDSNLSLYQARFRLLMLESEAGVQ